MQVQAAPGLKVPRENDPRIYITADQPVELDEVTGYYIRRLATGELVESPTTAAPDASEPTLKKKA